MNNASELRAMQFDADECPQCGGTGVSYKPCCDGYRCGCHGRPIEAETCSECGRDWPSDEEIERRLSDDD